MTRTWPQYLVAAGGERPSGPGECGARRARKLRVRNADPAGRHTGRHGLSALPSRSEARRRPLSPAGLPPWRRVTGAAPWGRAGPLSCRLPVLCPQVPEHGLRAADVRRAADQRPPGGRRGSAGPSL